MTATVNSTTITARKILLGHDSLHMGAFGSEESGTVPQFTPQGGSAINIVTATGTNTTFVVTPAAPSNMITLGSGGPYDIRYTTQPDVSNPAPAGSYTSWITVWDSATSGYYVQTIYDGTDTYQGIKFSFDLTVSEKICAGELKTSIAALGKSMKKSKLEETDFSTSQMIQNVPAPNLSRQKK